MVERRSTPVRLHVRIERRVRQVTSSPTPIQDANLDPQEVLKSAEETLYVHEDPPGIWEDQEVEALEATEIVGLERDSVDANNAADAYRLAWRFDLDEDVAWLLGQFPLPESFDRREVEGFLLWLLDESWVGLFGLAGYLERVPERTAAFGPELDIARIRKTARASKEGRRRYWARRVCEAFGIEYTRSS